jgi:hypothetical protein
MRMNSKVAGPEVASEAWEEDCIKRVLGYAYNRTHFTTQCKKYDQEALRLPCAVAGA